MLLNVLQVDPDAFAALIECIAGREFDKCDQVPAGDEDGYLVNPMGGTSVDMAGPAGYGPIWSPGKNQCSSTFGNG